MDQVMSAREAHSLKIRNALISACAELLSRQPIDAITINNIVETAGVAKGSFYNHFPDKEALAECVAAAIRSEVETAVRRSNVNVTDPAYKIARGVCNHIQFAVSNPGRAIIMLRGFRGTTSGEHPLNQDVQEHLREGVETGRLEPRCENSGLIVLLGSVFSTCLRVIDQGLSAEQAIELSTGVFTVVLCGFGLEEEEAHRIVASSARDIIKGQVA